MDLYCLFQPAQPLPAHPPELIDAMSRVQVTVAQHWKDLRKDCRNLDAMISGALDRDEFRDALRRNLNVNLTEAEFDYICGMFPRSGGKVAYNDFIRDFLKAM